MSFMRNCLLVILTKGMLTVTEILSLIEIINDHSILLVDHPDPN
ncbi:hypothetical protein S101359_03930 [Bacillus atrophaeus]|nr:hypothetical protein S101359_03930 [Bacillus atrophaeus]